MQDPLCATLTLDIPHDRVDVTAEIVCCSAKNYVEAKSRLESIIECWQTLAAEARSANPFLEPWSLMPALQHLAEDSVDLLIVWQDDKRQKMLLLVPMLRARTFHHIPLRHLTLWRHPYCYLCTPLVSPALPPESWLPLLSGINKLFKFSHCITHGWLDISELVAENKEADPSGNWHMHLDEAAKSRAGLKLTGDFKDYLGSLRTKKRKDLQRSRRRISELGNFSVDVVSESSCESLRQTAVEEFLSLENRGWKNAANTAIACSESHEHFFRLLISNGLQSGQILIMRMTLDNQTVGVLVVLVSACGRCGYTLKIATDSQYSKYSLGSLIILEFTEYAFANLDLSQLDSCAAENHPMINALWKQKVKLDNLTLVKKNSWQNLLVTGVRWLRSARQAPE